MVFSGYFLERATLLQETLALATPLLFLAGAARARISQTPVLRDAYPKLTTGSPKAWLSHLSQHTWLPFVH